MTEKNILPNIVNVITIIAASSFFFYFAGLISNSIYIKVLGLQSSWFDYQYYDFVTSGIFCYLPLLITTVPIIIEKTYPLWKLKIHMNAIKVGLIEANQLKKIFISDSKILEGKNSDNLEAEKNFEKINKIIAEYDNFNTENELIRKKLLDTWDSWRNRIILLISWFVSVLLFLYINNFLGRFLPRLSSKYFIILFIVVGLISYYVYYQIKFFFKPNEDLVLRTLRSVPIIFTFLVFVIPIAFGLLIGHSRLDMDDFHKIHVFEQNQEYDAKYISMNSDSYFLKINGNIEIVSKSNILRIKW